MEYINIKLIMDRLTRHPLLEDIPFETVVDYIVDFIRIVGAPASFLEKTDIIPIKDYRGILPCDFYQMIQVRNSKTAETYRYSSDNFHMSRNKAYLSDYTYKIQGNYIITSIPHGQLEIAYKAMPIDEEGYPLIPDNSSYSKALELYIKLQWFTMLFDMGKIQVGVLQNTQQQYAWAVGQAQVDLIRPTIDQMQNITNMWNKLLPDTTRDFQTGFVNSGIEERWRKH